MYHKQLNVYYTLAGIYRNFPDVFDNLHVPENINKNTLIHIILDKCASMELSYCDPTELKEIINYWSLSRLVSWERITQALVSEYNPIYNYDRFENISTSGSNSEQNTHTNRIDYTGTIGNSGTVGTIENDTTGETATKQSNKTTAETTTHENTAYNDGLSIATRDTTNGTETGTDTNTINGTATKNINTTDTNTETHNRTDTHSGDDTTTGTDTHTENNHLYGNIGVTSSQQLIQSSIDLYVTDMYYIISEEFKAKFCNLLYIY